MVATLCVLMMVLAIYFVWLYRKAKLGNLRRNGQVGLRTKAIMSSDETWGYIHAKYSWLFLLEAVIMALMSIDLAFSCIFTKGVSAFDPTCLVILWVLLVIMLGATAVIGIYANSDANNYNKRG